MGHEQHEVQTRFSLENVDEEFVSQMWNSTLSALNTLRESPFSGTVKDFTPLSLSTELAASQLLQRADIIPQECSQLLDGLNKEYKYQSDLTDAADFTKLDIGNKDTTFVASFRVHDYERTGAESYSAVDLIVYIDKHGVINTVPIVKKAIVAGTMGGGGLQRATQNRANKLQEMSDAGIPTIHIHGIDASTAIIYEKLYPDNKLAIYELINSDAAAAEKHLPKLVAIAKQLDDLAYFSLDFLRDIVFDGEEFLYLDAGSDVGNKGEDTRNTRPSLNILLKKFPEHTARIESLYSGENQIKKIREQVSSGSDNLMVA